MTVFPMERLGKCCVCMAPSINRVKFEHALGRPRRRVTLTVRSDIVGPFAVTGAEALLITLAVEIVWFNIVQSVKVLRKSAPQLS